MEVKEKDHNQGLFFNKSINSSNYAENLKDGCLHGEKTNAIVLAPGQSILGLRDALKKLYDTCWYIEQTKSGRYFFHRHKNLNAQVNSYTNVCTTTDRDAMIEEKLKEMFDPRDKRCYGAVNK